jgi:hypothetical protein
VTLSGSSAPAGGKALSFRASTDETLRGAGGLYALELRGVESGGDGSFDDPDYLDPARCTLPPCSWDVVPGAAGTYDFRAFLIDVPANKTAGQSDSVRLEWTNPPRPHDFEFLVGGKRQKLTPLIGGDEYVPIPAGDLEAEARWSTDAAGTGYSVVISTAEPTERTWATCSTGTSCRVPAAVPLEVDQELSWELEVVTNQGEKVVDGYRICLVGRRA